MERVLNHVTGDWIEKATKNSQKHAGGTSCVFAVYTVRIHTVRSTKWTVKSENPVKPLNSEARDCPPVAKGDELSQLDGAVIMYT